MDDDLNVVTTSLEALTVKSTDDDENASPKIPAEPTHQADVGIAIVSNVDTTKEAPSLPSSSKDTSNTVCATPQGPISTTDELFKSYTVRSSNGTPFLVISRSGSFVDGVPGMPSQTHQRAIQLITATWLSDTAPARSVLADFEGECPGFGGELTVGQFLLTNSVHPATYAVDRTAADAGEPGLLINMLEAEGAALVKLLMGNAKLAKIMWGTDGDIVSLRHQHNLGVVCRNVVDVQLQYSTPSRRLGMARALQRLSYNDRRLQSIPSKTGNLDFTPRIYNKRILPFPMSRAVARYSMDDLHRVEALVCGLGHRTVEDGKRRVDTFVTTMERDGGIDAAVTRLEEEMYYFRKKWGDPKLIKGVEILRSVLHIQQAFGQHQQPQLRMSEHQQHRVRTTQQMLVQSLRNTRAVIPADLSFAV